MEHVLLFIIQLLASLLAFLLIDSEACYFEMCWFTFSLPAIKYVNIKKFCNLLQGNTLFQLIKEYVYILWWNPSNLNTLETQYNLPDYQGVLFLGIIEIRMVGVYPK